MLLRLVFLRQWYTQAYFATIYLVGDLGLSVQTFLENVNDRDVCDIVKSSTSRKSNASKRPLKP